jgi:hypothetical protein
VVQICVGSKWSSMCIIDVSTKAYNTYLPPLKHSTKFPMTFGGHLKFIWISLHPFIFGNSPHLILGIKVEGTKFYETNPRFQPLGKQLETNVNPLGWRV